MKPLEHAGIAFIAINEPLGTDGQEYAGGADLVRIGQPPGATWEHLVAGGVAPQASAI
jgi:hypothetical protein